MTVVEEPERQLAPGTATRLRHGSTVLRWLSTTDHKEIGSLYLTTSFGFFLVGGVFAMVMRAELARPGEQFVTSAQYNQLFTMHGTIMLLLFATPTFTGFANWIMPLQIGSPDVAFPRLNAFTYWVFLFGGLIVLSGFFTADGAAAFGWFAYAPLNSVVHSPAPAATCGSRGWRWRVSARSSARSTSSPPSPASGRRG